MHPSLEPCAARRFRAAAALLACCCWTWPAHADDFLDAAQAFRLSTTQLADGRLALHWTIAPGYYLYRDRIAVTTPDGQALPRVNLPPGERKQDRSFGPVAVYHGALDVQVAPGTARTLRVRWQGCAEQGVCYPPQERDIVVDR